MKKIIISQPNCQQCKMLSMAFPDAEKVELQPVEILNFARAVGIKSLPFIVVTGDVAELEDELRFNVISSGHE